MIYNFENWRIARQAATAPQGTAHFHLVEDGLLKEVQSFLMALCRFKLQHHDYITIKVSDESFSTILAFINQMTDAYIHPRSSSHHFRFAEESAIFANPATF